MPKAETKSDSFLTTCEEEATTSSGTDKDGKIEVLDYEKLANLPVDDFVLMGYAIGVLINKVNLLIKAHNKDIQDKLDLAG